MRHDGDTGGHKAEAGSFAAATEHDGSDGPAVEAAPGTTDPGGALLLTRPGGWVSNSGGDFRVEPVLSEAAGLMVRAAQGTEPLLPP